MGVIARKDVLAYDLGAIKASLPADEQNTLKGTIAARENGVWPI